MYKKRLKKLKETEEEGKMLKNKNGITLIALVVTIVVLLILAGVTLTLVLDNNGIIQKSKDAKEQYGQARENEQADLSNLSDWIDDAVGVAKWDKILDDAEQNPDKYKHPEQSDTNGDIGIGTDEKPVNLDLWNYEIINTNEIRLGISCSSTAEPGYNNNNIINGEIQGKVPQYIKIDGKDEFYPVTDMGQTFMRCDKLVIAPKIPETVVTMWGGWIYGTFFDCTSLTTAPEIPSSVTNMNFTFYDCTSLTTVPEIPSSVTDMGSTFSGCTSLTTAPEIPSSVTDMEYTFFGCTSLTGNLVINANPTGYDSCLSGASTAAGTNLVVSGTSTLLDEIIATKSENSNITKGN